MLALTQFTGFNARRSGPGIVRGTGTAGITLGLAGAGLRHTVGAGVAGITLGVAGAGTVRAPLFGDGLATVTLGLAGAGTVIPNPVVAMWPFDSLNGSGDFEDAFGSADITPGDADVTVGSAKVGAGGVAFYKGAAFANTDIFPALPGYGALAFWVRGEKVNNGEDLRMNLYEVGAGHPLLQFTLEADDAFRIYAWPATAPFVFSGSEDTWYFVVLNSDGGTFELFVDSVSQGTESPFWFGGLPFRASNAGYADEGTIRLDEFAIFDRTLTQVEIDYLYNGGAGQAYPYSF